MKIIRPYMRMLTTGMVVMAGMKEFIDSHGEWDIKQPLEFTNFCGRISHRSEDAENQNAERFLRSIVLQHGDWSVTEHVHISVDAYVDRGITHEIVRHRIAAYTQESTRFVNYAKKMAPSFMYPKPDVECEKCLSGNEPSVSIEPMHYWTDGNSMAAKLCVYDVDWLQAIATAEEKYKRLLAKGWRPQEARSVFPNALASRIIMTYNLRTWRLFFLMRTSVEAHPQMRQVTIPLLEEFKKMIPVLYEDIEPNARQIDNMKKPR